MKTADVKFYNLFASWKTYYVSLLKLIVFPMGAVEVLLLIRMFASGLVDSDLILGTFMAFAVPTAGLASTFSEQFDGDSESAVTFTLGTTILSILTLPLLYWLLKFLTL